MAKKKSLTAAISSCRGRGGQVVTFEDQAASHGGLGGAQDYPFLIHPAHVTPSLDGRDGPVALYEHFIGYQSDLKARSTRIPSSRSVAKAYRGVPQSEQTPN
jgi:hypothetical protein